MASTAGAKNRVREKPVISFSVHPQVRACDENDAYRVNRDLTFPVGNVISPVTYNLRLSGL
jgi:hypothetical protein